MAQTTMDLTSRVARLEQQNRWLRRGLLVSVAMPLLLELGRLGGPVVDAQTPHTITADTVAAQTFGELFRANAAASVEL